MPIIIWIDINLDNQENSQYTKELESIKILKLKLFKKVYEAIIYMKTIKFEETKIIVSGSLYSELVENFKENIIYMCIIPKIIVFTHNKDEFLKYNKDFKNKDNGFYNLGGIATEFKEIKAFINIKSKKDCATTTQNLGNQNGENNSLSIMNKIGEKLFGKSNDIQLTFEYIDRKEKLILPLFFKVLIDNVSENNMESYTNFLFSIYSKKFQQIKELFDTIESIPKVPIEILSKYYARLFTTESDFHKDLNKDLRLNKIDKYLSYIKALYEGVKLKSLPLANNNILYRGSIISNSEINKIKNYINNKISGLPSSILFSKSFLSFSKEEKLAKAFLNKDNIDNNLSKVLFILEKEDNIGYNLSTHGDIETISCFPKEKEVLFFPFSSFEIKEINDLKINKEKGYEIKLLYLGKYLEEIENDKNIIIKENKIPDSEFKNQLMEFGLIEKEKIESINIKTLYNSYKKYEKEIENNFIIGEINIGPEDINKDIQIINSFENYKSMKRYKEEDDDWKYENEEQIKANIEIKINEKKIEFNYTYKFEKEGKYKIEYLFNLNLTKTNHLFYYCSRLIYLNFSNFNTGNITDMSRMFEGCNSLKYLELSNFNTQNVTNMTGMFDGCESLISLNLTNFKTQNVIDMSYMFSNCKSLTKLDLSNFNTHCVTDMSSMFEYCVSLNHLDLSNFNTENVKDMSGMFLGTDSLEKENIIIKNNIILPLFK